MHDEGISTEKWLSSLSEDGVGFKVWDSTIDLEFDQDYSQKLTGEFGLELSLTPLPPKSQTKMTEFSLEAELAAASAAVEQALAKEQALKSTTAETTPEVEPVPDFDPRLAAPIRLWEQRQPETAPVPENEPREEAPAKKKQKPVIVIDGKYQVASELGKGVMCHVYKVKELSTGTVMVLKILPKDPWRSEQILQKAHNEARKIMSLNNDHLVPFRAFGMTSTGHPYILMDYLKSITLTRAVKASDGLPLPRVVQVFDQLCRGLSACHAAGITHRDIRPENIMFLSKKGDYNLKLVDFGLAKLVSEGTTPMKQLEATGDIFGNPPYMSPEECRGEAIDERSDIYSLGCVMYFAMTGQPPYAGASSTETLRKHINEALPPPSRIKKKIASANIAGWVTVTDLEYIVMRCLEKVPAQRYQSVEQILEDLDKLRKQIPLQQIQHKAATGLRTAEAGRTDDASGKRPNFWLVLIAVALVLCASALGYILAANKSPDTVPNQNKVQTIEQKVERPH